MAVWLKPDLTELTQIWLTWLDCQGSQVCQLSHFSRSNYISQSSQFTLYSEWITAVVHFSYPSKSESQLLARYPKEIVLLQQMCCRCQTWGVVTTVKYKTTISQHKVTWKLSQSRQKPPDYAESEMSANRVSIVKLKSSNFTFYTVFSSSWDEGQKKSLKAVA